MTRAVLLVAGVGLSVAAALAFLCVANRDTLAELPDTTHDPDCDVCHWVDDLGVAEPIDFALWASEMERTS